MTLRSILVVIVIAFFCMHFQCNVNDPPDCYENLPVPYHQQECENYCGVACVQMWADFDGWSPPPTQSTIASYMGIAPGSNGVNPYELERAVGAYTASYGYLARKEWWEPGAQGDLISSTVVGIDQGVPAIMPFDMVHAVLIKGSKWNEKPDGSPLAKRVYYHDPAYNNHDQDISAAELKALFVPAPIDYWVVLGWEDYLWNGIMGHDTFVLMGGTYYGGPSYYNPKNLDLSQQTN